MPSTLRHENAPPYDLDEYFAFIESSDELDPKAETELPDWWRRVVGERGRKDRPAPDHLVWIDCVHARLFEELPWRDEICPIGDPDAAERRRQQIRELDPGMLVVAPLLLTRRFAIEGLLLADLGEAAWHRVRLGLVGEIPTVMAPDFDLDPQFSRWVYFERYMTCSKSERRSLENVFNLNFLPDATLDGLLGTPGAVPPLGLGGGSGEPECGEAGWEPRDDHLVL